MASGLKMHLEARGVTYADVARALKREAQIALLQQVEQIAREYSDQHKRRCTLQPRPPQFAPTGPAAERYEARIAFIGPRIGAKKLGYNLTAVPPGKRAFPFHSHRVQEEMFYLVEGTGEVRIGAERFPVRAGDVIACPTGGPETAHQIINTGATELRYLAVSTKEPAEIGEYPDTGKIAGFGESLRFVMRGDQQVGYWDDE